MLDRLWVYFWFKWKNTQFFKITLNWIRSVKIFTFKAALYVYFALYCKHIRVASDNWSDPSTDGPLPHSSLKKHFITIIIIIITKTAHYLVKRTLFTHKYSSVECLRMLTHSLLDTCRLGAQLLHNLLQALIKYTN